MTTIEAGTPVDDKDFSRLVFVNRPGLFGLLLKNMGLTIVTLGIYRFWARTALRRYWWSSVVIDGDPLEYTGTGAELFLGFLIFLLLISPFALVWVGLKVFAPDPRWRALLTLGFYVFLVFFLIPIALFRARRYRMSRTRWRGIRGGMTGSTLRFLGITFAGFLATMLTFGIMAPWMRMRQTRYITNCSSFGDQTLSFDGTSRPLILRWLAIIAVPGLLMILSIVLIGGVVAKQAAAGGQPDPKMFAAASAFAMIPLWVAIPIFMIGLIWYNTYEFRYILNHTSVGAIRLHSKIEPWAVVGYVVAFFFLAGIAFAIVIGVVVAATFGVAAIVTHGGETGPPVFFIAVIGLVCWRRCRRCRCICRCRATDGWRRSAMRCRKHPSGTRHWTSGPTLSAPAGVPSHGASRPRPA
ncbi:MAG: DUF898 family protein [Aliidongia sp.]